MAPNFLKHKAVSAFHVKRVLGSKSLQTRSRAAARTQSYRDRATGRVNNRGGIVKWNAFIFLEKDGGICNQRDNFKIDIALNLSLEINSAPAIMNRPLPWFLCSRMDVNRRPILELATAERCKVILEMH